MPQFLKTVVEQGVAVIAIHHPPVNVLTQQIFKELGEAVRAFQKDPAVRAIVVTGEGANFAAGADVKEIATIRDAATGERMSREANQLGQLLWESPVPIIAAINGYCFGGGSELALACHMRIAGDKAKIAQPEIKVGFIPGMGGTQRLPRLVGTAKGLEILLTGEPVGAQEALRIGWVNAVAPEAELRAQAVALGRKIGAMSKLAVARILQAVRDGMSLPIAQALDLESRLFGEMMPTEDKKEGVTAFVEKRPAQFKDR